MSPTTIYRAESFSREEANLLLNDLQASTLELGNIRGKALNTAVPFTVQAIYSRQGNSFEFHAADLKKAGDVSLARDIDPQTSGLHAWPDHNFSGEGIWPAAEIAGTVPCGPGGEAIDDGMSLTLKNSQNQDTFTFSGMDAPTGSNVTLFTNGFYIDSRTGVLAGRGIGGTALFQSGWKAYFFRGIFADSFTGLESSRTQLSFEPPATSNSIEIRSFVASPSTINPENNEQTVLTADVAETGFVNPSLAWTMTPTPPSDSSNARIQAKASLSAVDPGGGGGDLGLPPIFSGTGDISSGLAHLTQVWNGKSTTGQSLPFGSYPYTLNVTVVDGVSGQSQSATADTTVTLAANPLLEVFKDSTLYAIGNGLRVEEETPAQRAERRKLLQHVRKPEGPWTVKAMNLSGAGPFTVQVHSNVSAQPATVVLTGSGGVFTGTLDHPEQLILANPAQASQTMTLARASEAGPALFDKIFQLPSSLNFPAPRARLGRLEARLFLADDSPKWEALDNNSAPLDDLELAPTLIDNVLAAGFESLQFSLNADGKQLEANVKTAHGSQLYLANLHGLHDSGDLILNEDDSQHLPTSRLSNLAGNVTTLILESCEVLDLRDDNNFFSTDHYSGLSANVTMPNPIVPHAPDAAVAARRSPGLSWYAQTVIRGKVGQLMGYAAPAPEVALAIALPDKLAAQNLDKKLGLAWLQANQATARSEVGTFWLCLNACAFEKGNYYYIPYVVPSNDGTFDREWPAPLRFPHLPPNTVKDYGPHSLPIQSWPKEPESWKTVPNSLALPVVPQ